MMYADKSMMQESNHTGIESETAMVEGCCETYEEAHLLEPVGNQYHRTRSFCVMKQGALDLQSNESGTACKRLSSYTKGAFFLHEESGGNEETTMDVYYDG